MTTSTIPKEAIEKAIEGGWRSEYLNCHIITHSDWYITVGDSRFSCKGEPASTVALDPSFWQSLGKALGWSTMENHQQSRREALRYYYLILTRGDTKKFWDELLAQSKPL